MQAGNGGATKSLETVADLYTVAWSNVVDNDYVPSQNPLNIYLRDTM